MKAVHGVLFSSVAISKKSLILGSSAAEQVTVYLDSCIVVYFI